MNAAVSLLGQMLPATVHVHAEIPAEHPSARLLGAERMGSGTVIDSSGLILTVSYVVIGASTIHVTTLDGQQYEAELVKYDFASGLAVLRVQGVRLPSLRLRSTADLQPGEQAFAVSSVGPGAIRVADGFVSQIGPFDATWEYMLDRAILASVMNPGLGGGPLVDRHGDVLGVVSLNLTEIAKFTLSVPSDCFLDAAPAFLTHDGRPAIGTRAWLGVFCHLVDQHVVVAGIMDDGPAARAGLHPGDVLLAVDERDLADRAALYRHVWERQPGDAVNLKVFRDRAVQAVTVATGDVAAFFGVKPVMPLGDFVVAYLQKLGITHLFGIPGDLVIRLFLRFGKKRGLRIVTLSHEPGVGFAADGYARATGRIGVACVTYGAGGHNMVNPVAGSFAERVPVLVLSGGPSDAERKLGTLIHHQAKEIESQWRIYREVTCAAHVLDDVRTAAERVHATVQQMWREQQPGYLEIHRDMVERPIPVPREILDWDGGLQFGHSDERKVDEAVRDTKERWAHARRPLTVVGIETYRYKVQREVRTLAEKLGAPVVTTVLSKGAFPMDHPQYLGVHIGAISPLAIAQRVTRADLVLSLGNLLTDMDLGARPPSIPRERSIWAAEGRVNVSWHTYDAVQIRDFVRELLKVRWKKHHEVVRYADNLPPPAADPTRALRVTDVLHELNAFLRDRRGYGIVADSGDMLFAGLDVRVGRGGPYLAPGFYASMGFGVPAALGLQLGAGVRPIVLSGDGAFQMTGPEIAQAPRHGLNPIVVVINNGGWQIFRPIVSQTSLLDVPPWPYAELAKLWGGQSFVVGSAAEMRAALACAARIKSFVLIEARIDPQDLSPISRKYIQASGRKGRGRG